MKIKNITREALTFLIFLIVYWIGFMGCYCIFVSDLKNQNSKMDEQIATLTDAVEARDASITDLDRQLDTLSDENDQLKNEITELQENLDELEQENLEKEAEEEPVVKESNSYVAPVTASTPTPETVAYTPSNGSCLTPSGGVYNGPSGKETYYNLNMNGVISNAQAQGIQGDYWVREDGVKMYGDYVIVAANLDTHPRGSTVETSLGTGIVLDTGGFAASDPTQLDIAVDW